MVVALIDHNLYFVGNLVTEIYFYHHEVLVYVRIEYGSCLSSLFAFGFVIPWEAHLGKHKPGSDRSFRYLKLHFLSSIIRLWTCHPLRSLLRKHTPISDRSFRYLKLHFLSSISSHFELIQSYPLIGLQYYICIWVNTISESFMHRI